MTIHEGVRALLADGHVRAALLDRLATTMPQDERWLLDAAQSTTPEALVAALSRTGEDPGQVLGSLGQVLQDLESAGGLGPLAEVGGQAVRQVPPQWPGRAEPPSVPLRLLGSALSRLARADPDGARAALGPDEAPEDVYATTRAEVAAQLKFELPDFSYADLLGREPGPPETDDEDGGR